MDYHVDPELLVETLAALQSELLLGCSMVARLMRHSLLLLDISELSLQSLLRLSLSMQQQKQLQEAVESHRTELMASVRRRGRCLRRRKEGKRAAGLSSG